MKKQGIACVSHHKVTAGYSSYGYGDFRMPLRKVQEEDKTRDHLLRGGTLENAIGGCVPLHSPEK